MKPDLRPDLLSLALGGLAIGIAEFVPMGHRRPSAPAKALPRDLRSPARAELWILDPNASLRPRNLYVESV
jgi:hypothetical protein